MTVQEAISARHSVRTYLTKPVEPAIVNALRAEIRACNAEGGLHIQLVMNEPMAFRGFFAHYGKFRGVCNYIVLAGKRAKDLDERAGWFGERLVLLAQTLGLNTCWVGLTFSKAVARRSYVLAPDERLVCVIAFGYGAEQGEAQTIRSYVRGCNISFSGAETAAKRFLEQGMLREDVAASAMKCIGKTLEKLIINAREETGLASVLLFGGVMSSTYLRGFLQRRLPELQFAGIRYAADNACGLAMQARNIYLAEGK